MAQRVKTRTVQTATTNAVSQELVKTMLSASFGCVTFLRGIFPDDNFREERYNYKDLVDKANQRPKLNNVGTKIMKIARGVSTEANVLLDYLENGIYDALSKSYLKAIILSISLDPEDQSNVHECYTFQIQYSADKKVPLLMIQESKKNLSTDLLPLDSAKKTLQMLFRQLIMMTQTLEPLPGREISSSHCSDAIDENKFISIRLYYVDSTPEDYQPSGFVEASDSTSLKFVTKFAGDVPYDQRVGALNTGFHACTLKITTLSDLDGGPADDQNSRPYVQIWDAEANAKAVDTLAIPSDAVPESQMLAPPIFEKLHISGQEPPGHDADISPEPDILPPSQIEKLVARRREAIGTQSVQSLRSPLEGSQNATRVQRSPLQDVTGQVSAIANCRYISSYSVPGLLTKRIAKDKQSANETLTENRTTNSTVLPAQDDRLPDNSLPRSFVACSHRSQSEQRHGLLDGQDDLVTCECGDTSEDGKMIACERCNCWAHIWCYGYMKTPLEDYHHVCYTCLFSDRPVGELDTMRDLSLFRRALMLLWQEGYHYRNTQEFATRIGCELGTAGQVLRRLVKEGWANHNKGRTGSEVRKTRNVGGRKSTKEDLLMIKNRPNRERMTREYFDPQRSIGHLVAEVTDNDANAELDNTLLPYRRMCSEMDVDIVENSLLEDVVDDSQDMGLARNNDLERSETQTTCEEDLSMPVMVRKRKCARKPEDGKGNLVESKRAKISIINEAIAV